MHGGRRVHPDVVENLPDLHALGDKCNQVHLPTAFRARQREDLKDARYQHRPEVSAFNPNAVPRNVAAGLMQIMPATARRYEVQSEPGSSISSKLTDPEVNISTGTRYPADLLRLFGGQAELAVAANNAGEGAVKCAGNRIPNDKQTRAGDCGLPVAASELNPQHVSANSSRPISMRRISLVPAPISYSLASRHRRPSGYSLM